MSFTWFWAFRVSSLCLLGEILNSYQTYRNAKSTCFLQHAYLGFCNQLRVTISPKTKNWDHQKIVFHSLALNVYVVWHQSCNVNGLFGLSNKTTSPNEPAYYWPCSQPLRSKMVILSKVIATGTSWVVLLHFNVSLEMRTKNCPKMKVSKTLIAIANVVILAVS